MSFTPITPLVVKSKSLSAQLPFIPKERKILEAPMKLPMFEAPCIPLYSPPV